MSVYKVLAKNKDMSEEWELPFKSAAVDWNHNNVHTSSIYVDFVYLQEYLARQNTTPKNLFETEFINIEIYRDDALFFAGYLADVNYQKYSEAFNVTLGVKSWLGYFENRYYSGRFDGVDAGEIAWSAIGAVNDIGVTEGLIEETKDRDRGYVDDDVAKIVKQLTSDEIIDGFEFDISNSKVFSVKETIGTTLPNIIFEEGSNVYEYSLGVKLVGGVFTDGIILGGGMGDKQIRRTYNAGSLYEDKWYRQQALLKDVNVEDVGILDDKVEQFITQRKDPQRVLTVKVQSIRPELTDYQHGDTVRVRLPSIEVDGMMRIKKKSVYFGGDEYVNLEFII